MPKVRAARCSSCKAWKKKDEVSRRPMLVGKLFCHECLSKIAAEERAAEREKEAES